MKTEFIPKVVTLLAGAIVCITSIVKNMDVTYSLEILLATLIIFYIIGCIAQKIIEKTVASNAVVKQEQEKQEEQENVDSEENQEKQEKQEEEKPE